MPVFQAETFLLRIVEHAGYVAFDDGAGRFGHLIFPGNIEVIGTEVSSLLAHWRFESARRCEYV